MYTKDGRSTQTTQPTEDVDLKTIEWLKKDLERRAQKRADSDKQLVSSRS
jgi:hypothetical protein